MRYAMTSVVVGVFLLLAVVPASRAGNFFDVSDNGNVGIGTTTAGALLDVARPATTSNTELIDIRANGFTQTISSGLTNARFNQFNQYTLSAATAQTVTNGTTLHVAGPPTGGGAGPATITTGSALRIAPGVVANTTNAYGLYVDAPTGATNNYAAVFPSGNVGIGTTGPDSILQIGSGTTTGGNANRRLSVIGAGQTDLLLQDSSSSTVGGMYVLSGEVVVRAFSNHPLVFLTNNGEKMRITNTGNVGIGETAPGSKLSVSGGATIGASYDTTAAPSNGMIVEGNVGIGTASPQYKLHIRSDSGASSGNAALGLENGSVGYSAMSLKSDTTEFRFLVEGSGNGSRGLFIQSAPGADRMHIGTNGNVSIGTVNQGNILTVVQNSVTDPIADAWTTYSSIRWKEHIVPFSGALQKIERLRTVYFDWKSTQQRDLGMIAEEVGAVLPEVVVYEPNGKDAKSIDYGRMTAVLVQAIKEQQVQIRELQKEIADLKRSQ